MSYAQTLDRFLKRQEDVTRTKMGAGEMPWDRRFNVTRWNRELVDDLQAVCFNGDIPGYEACLQHPT